MNLHRVQKKGEELYSQEYDNDRTVQYKERNATEKWPDETSPIDRKEGINNEDYDKK